MTPEEFKQLSPGDIVTGHNGVCYMVTSVHEGHVAVVPALSADDADTWRVAMKGLVDGKEAELQKGHDSPQSAGKDSGKPEKSGHRA